MDIKSFFGFESMVEKIAMKQYTANIKKVCTGLQGYLFTALNLIVAVVYCCCRAPGLSRQFTDHLIVNLTCQFAVPTLKVNKRVIQYDARDKFQSGVVAGRTASEFAGI